MDRAGRAGLLLPRPQLAASILLRRLQSRRVGHFWSIGRTAAMLLQERQVDQLNMDAAILHRLDGVGELSSAASGFAKGVGFPSPSSSPVRPLFLDEC
jgi:hypothetical protein